uniref:Adenine DNA glycosylase n=1 Tax=Schlesneria paludicola TaxID=360056 RepID=A0A7C4QNJ1_9PLAN
MDGHFPSLRQQRSLLRALYRWHLTHARPLPWRGETDPYRIWLREIMLQQTTVAAVIPYLERFLRRFPTVQSLAAAEESDVLRQWEGLGYYRRARNLHRAAQVLVRAHGGQLPSDVATLRQLPGVGRYTAGAIASFAFNAPAPILEANTLRLHTRLLAYEGDPRGAAGQRVLWQWAESLVHAAATLPESSPAAANQALMDLGATVCTATAPDCPACPVQRWCGALRRNLQHELPRSPARRKMTHVVEAAVAVQRSGRFLLRRRRPPERWAGLWDFPRFPLDEVPPVAAALIAGVQAQSGLVIDVGPQIAEFVHFVTRYRITLRCYAATVAAGRVTPALEHAWVRPADFARYPLSTTGRKLARLLLEGRDPG